MPRLEGFCQLSQENWRYYEGDVFCYWTGPKPEPNHPKYAIVIDRLKKAFHRYNVVRKIVSHYCNALIGKPFNWYLKNASGEAESESEAERYLQQWWDWNSKIAIANKLARQNPLADAVCQMLATDNGDGIGTGYLRLYSPRRYAELDPWKRMILHCPEPGSIQVKRDADGIAYEAIYHSSTGIEIYTLLENGLTRIEAKGREPEEVDLGGRLPIFELNGRCIITEDIKDSQNAINKGLTLKGENLNFAGFLERVVLNGQMPGKWIQDPSAPGGEKFVPSADGIQGGAGQALFLQGIPIGDRKNPAGYTNPAIAYRDPIEVRNFLADFDLNLKCAYMAADLGHLLSVADGTLAGVSRKTIKEDFTTGLIGYASNIQSVLGGVFDMVLLILSDSMNRADFLNYSSVVELKLNTGSPLPEERKENREDYNAGLLSWATAVMATGEVSDPDAEWDLKMREREEMRALQAQEQNFVEQFDDDANAGA